MQSVLKRTLLVLALLVYFSGTCLSLEKKTHELINETIAKQPWLNNYLIANLGFRKGFEEKFNGKEVFKWIAEGGIKEDEPAYTRSFNHFHDPLTYWGSAGYKGIFNSSLVWAQNQSPFGTSLDWSWKRAGFSFYKGLTSISKNDKEKNFADTFRALGQVMHLVQDGSVPAHVRNDTHVYLELFGFKMGYHYEKWVENNHKQLNLIPSNFDKSILNINPEPIAPIPIANIFDTNKYDGSNLNIAVGSSIGITEYANANFFSEGTIFKSYPHPTYEDTNYLSIDWKNPEIVDAEDGKFDNRIYIRKTAGEQVQRLASLSYISYNCIKKGYYQFSPLVLDNKVYEEYASKLIPRAVGYSAGLLDYFFRGKLQVTTVPIIFKNTIQYLRVMIKNMTPNETMEDGEFTLTYSYTPTGGNPDGSQDIWGQAPVVSSGTLLYDGEEKVIDFWLPTSIPEEKYDSVNFTLAFKGTLGKEVGAVIGKTLTFGEIKFEEEWNNGLAGNHNWAHTDFNLLGQNPDNGSTSNTIEGDSLIKDNIRYVGKRTARVNESFVDYSYNNGQFRDILPILITPNTYFQFKIDAMWINEIPPAPLGETNHWQALILRFNNGLSMQYFQEGQGLYTGSKTVYLTFPLGQIIMDNIYEMFQGAGITIPNGSLSLESISFLQQLFPLDQPSTVEHHQHMEIDSIRIIEGKTQ